MNDIEKAIETLNYVKTSVGVFGQEDDIDLAISALEKQSDKNCSRCVDRDRCVIHENFNIDYCSDWSVEE